MNVDGFNEFALGLYNVRAGLDPILPSAHHMWPLTQELSPRPESEDYYRAAYQILVARRSATSHTRLAHNARFGTYYAWHAALAARAKSVLASEISEYEAFAKSDRWSAGKKTLSLDLPPIGGDPVQRILEIWLKCSQQMRALAMASGIRYVHIVQPNQYFSKHQFSERERRIALASGSDHEYRVGVALGYPMLTAELLAKNQIVSGIALFDAELEEVYADACCHYNSRGETILARAVADVIAREVNAGFN